MVFLINAYSFGCLGNSALRTLRSGQRTLCAMPFCSKILLFGCQSWDCLIASPCQKDNRMTIISITHRITYRIICLDHIKKVDRIYHFLYNLPGMSGRRN